MTLHKDLTGADLHEPKGLTTAAAGQVYVCTTPGVGVWSKLGSTSLDRTSVPGAFVFARSTNVTNINTTGTHYIATGRAGTLTTIYGIVTGTITTDVTVNLVRNGTTVVTVTIAAGSVAGQNFTVSNIATNNVFSPGDVIYLNFNGTGSAIAGLSLDFVFAL